MRIAVVLTLLFAQAALAYPIYLRDGYRSCLACHVSMQGGGELSAYGSGYGASEALIKQDVENNPDAPIPAFRPGAIGRAMYLRRPGADPRFFAMQSDLLASLRTSARTRADLQVGYNGESSASSLPLKDRIVLRKLTAAWRSEESEYEVVAGRDFIPSGINMDDHTLWTRARNRRSFADFVTMARIDTSFEKYDASGFLYGPSGIEKHDDRESGVGGRAEWSVADKFTVGALAQMGVSPAITRIETGVFSRSGWGRLGVLAEADFTQRFQHDDAHTQFSQLAAFIRPYYKVIHGLELGITGEALRVGAPFTESAYRLGPNLNVRVWRFFSIVSDLKTEFRSGQKQTAFTAQLLGHYP